MGPQSLLSDSLRTAINKASENPPQTNPRMSTIVNTVDIVMGPFSQRRSHGATQVGASQGGHR